MNGWFLAIIIIGVLSVGINLANHGKPREGNYNFWGSLFGMLLQTWLVYMAIKSGL